MRVALSTLQWTMFILAGSVVAPLAIGQAYGMSPQEISEFVQRTLFVLGIVALMQTWWGHRLPIMEGPAVLWWGVFLLFGTLAPAMGQEPRSLLPALGLGLVFSGILFVLLSICGWIAVIRRLFTPAVIGNYFLLLVAQMSGPFLFTVPGIWSSGWPEWKGGILLTAGIVTLLLLSNMIASMEAVGQVVGHADGGKENRTGLIMGGSQVLSAVFATVGFVPLSYTAGFIMTTRMKEKLPFLLGNLLLVLISFFPAVTRLFASIPVSVGYASVFLSFVNMLGMGLREIGRAGLGERQIFIVGISLMIGTGCMFLPSSFFIAVPPFLSPLISNGLLMGVGCCLLLERLVRKDETVQISANT